MGTQGSSLRLGARTSTAFSRTLAYTSRSRNIELRRFDRGGMYGIRVHGLALAFRLWFGMACVRLVASPFSEKGRFLHDFACRWFGWGGRCDGAERVDGRRLYGLERRNDTLWPGQRYSSRRLVPSRTRGSRYSGISCTYHGTLDGRPWQGIRYRVCGVKLGRDVYSGLHRGGARWSTHRMGVAWCRGWNFTTSKQ